MDYQGEELNEVLRMFQQEGNELLHSIYESVSILENSRDDSDAMLQLSRDLHNFKGSVRMLGFYNIQSLAHKMEDVTFLIKDHEIPLTDNIIEEFFDIIDCFNTLVEGTVREKREYTTPEISKHIDNLDKFIKKEKQPEFSEKGSLKSHFEQIEACFIESNLLCLKYEDEGDFLYLEELQNKLDELKTCFSEIDYCENEKIFERTNLYFSGFSKKEKNDITYLKEALDDLTEDFEKLCSENNLETIDFKKSAQNQLEEINSHHDFIKQDEIKVQKIRADADDELINLMKELSEKISQEGAEKEELTELTQKIIDKIDISEFRKTFKVILKIIKTSFYDKETLGSLRHIILDGIDIYRDSELGLEDYELLGQRVLIIEQISYSRNFSIPKIPEKIKKEEKKEGKDWIKTLDSGAIKTLRVDSQTLDDLGVQIGDLIGARIKTSEHLQLSRKFQQSLEDWQKDWHKVGYYIKYFDKKYLNEEEGYNFDIQTITSYNRQLMSLYNQHTEQISKLIESFININKSLQENEGKLSSVSSILEGMVKSLRILPLATIFHLFPRMVHNISLEQNKTIDFKIEGSEVSADKKIIEDIKIPLIHIIRNSIDHGIETPKERTALGKNPTGKITINALHHNNKIIIKISDDGRGVDIEKIRKKIVELNLASKEEAANLKDEEIIGYIFTPGFSTQEEITDISGRGMGLNIVNNTINELNGKINIISNKNKGTDIIIELPVAMATVNAFIASEQDNLYAIPVSSIKSVLRLSRDEIFMKEENNYFIYEEKMVPIFTLSQILKIPDKTRFVNKLTVMLLEIEGERMGIIVDKLIGDQEILLKKLAPPFYRVKNISGITTLANGETCLILNALDIIKTVLPVSVSKVISTSNELLKIKNNEQYKIVIIDDSITTRTLEKKILQGRGYSVAEFENPIDALKKLDEEGADLIVTDYEMPQINGAEFVKEIKSKENLSKIPVILLTSYSSNFWKNDFKDYDFAHVLFKGDFNQQNFTEMIEKILSEKNN